MLSTPTRKTKDKQFGLAGLDSIPVGEKPARLGKHWQGIQHGRLVTGIIEEADRRGLNPDEGRWFVGCNGARLWGSTDLSIPQDYRLPDGTDLITPDGMSFSFGINHSNDGLIAARFFAGARIFVCDNGMIDGEHALTRKHTRGLDIEEAIREAFDRYLISISTLHEKVSGMAELDLSDRNHADHLLVESVRKNVIPASKLPDVDREFNKPRHSEFEPRNGWSLYNAFTQVAKDLAVQRQIWTMTRARELILAA